MDGLNYSIPSHHFMEMYQNVSEPGDSVCVTSITQLDIMQEGQENLFIVGDVFMQEYYTIFDRDNNQVGFAKAVHPHEEETHDIDLEEADNLSDFMWIILNR